MERDLEAQVSRIYLVEGALDRFFPAKLHFLRYIVLFRLRFGGDRGECVMVLSFN